MYIYIILNFPNHNILIGNIKVQESQFFSGILFILCTFTHTLIWNVCNRNYGEAFIVMPILELFFSKISYNLRKSIMKLKRLYSTHKKSTCSSNATIRFQAVVNAYIIIFSNFIDRFINNWNFIGLIIFIFKRKVFKFGNLG